MLFSLLRSAQVLRLIALICIRKESKIKKIKIENYYLQYSAEFNKCLYFIS